VTQAREDGINKYTISAFETLVTLTRIPTRNQEQPKEPGKWKPNVREGLGLRNPREFPRVLLRA
jgi:hypothetical protein